MVPGFTGVALALCVDGLICQADGMSLGHVVTPLSMCAAQAPLDTGGAVGIRVVADGWQVITVEEEHSSEFAEIETFPFGRLGDAWRLGAEIIDMHQAK